jgi:hypothetical protein
MPGALKGEDVPPPSEVSPEKAGWQAALSLKRRLYLGDTPGAIDELQEWFYLWAPTNPEKLDELVNSLKATTETSAAFSIAVLTASLPLKHVLNLRDDFLQSVRRKLVYEGLDATAILLGLT